VLCVLAKVVNHVTSFDLTPAMIEQAKILETKKQLTNITWKIGYVAKILPFAHTSFSLVVTRSLLKT
jgi:ubiquinone/menaquinone biosynthesis C-methylase UbiE